MPPTPNDPVTAYARAVTTGRTVAGRLVRLAGERHLRDLETGHERGLWFDAKAADHAIGFFPKFLRHYEGAHDGEPFLLAPPQEFITGSLFGWKRADGMRRFRTAYIEEAKGNGKSPHAAGTGLYGLTMDDEPGAQIYAAAVTRDQADIMFSDATKMAAASPDLAERLEILGHNIAFHAERSFFRPVSSEGRSLDGKRVHIALIDEIHEHRTPVVVNKMRAGTKGRRQALIFEITNSGYDQLSVCWSHHEQSRKILEGTIEDDSWFGYVCTLDPCEACRLEGHQQPRDGCADCDDWQDERVWPKVNPLLDVAVTRDYLRQQVRDAQNMPGNRDLILRLNFCIWTSRHTTWIPADRWRTGAAFVADDDLVGVPCFAGLDLGQTDDFSAHALAFMLEDGRMAVRMRYWIPEATKKAKPDRPYSTWERAGLLVVTDGETTDYDRIEAEVAERCERHGVVQLAYDKRFAEQMALHLSGLGITCVDMPQGFQLNEAIRYIVNLVGKGLLCHGGDPVLAWMVSNVVTRKGQRGEVRLDKDRSAEKIDGASALAMAVARAIVQPSTKSVYEERGLLVLG